MMLAISKHEERYSLRCLVSGQWYGHILIEKNHQNVSVLLKKAKEKAISHEKALETRLDHFKEQYPEEYTGFKMYSVSYYDDDNKGRLIQTIAYECEHVQVAIETKENLIHFCVWASKNGECIKEEYFDCEEKAKAFAFEAIEKLKLKALVG